MRIPLSRVCLCLALSVLLSGPSEGRAEGSFSAFPLQTPLQPAQQSVRQPEPQLSHQPQRKPGLQPAPVRDIPDLTLPELPPLPEQPAGRIMFILDGDSVRLADRRTIRLACIDAPDLALSSPYNPRFGELKRDNFYVVPGTVHEDPEQAEASHSTRQRPQAKEQMYAAEAKQKLVPLVLKERVTLRAPYSRKDTHGRLVADVVLDDGTSLSAFMVSMGLAFVVRDPDYPEDYVTSLLSLQRAAIAGHRGFWNILFALEASREPWIGNSETFLFYSSRDVRGQQIKPRLRVYFGTLLDAFLAGFAPARSRDFWPSR